ncbi:hypothetical protein PS691_02646 [Pseudomonas fluorescens]|uniref:Uncharacterized protein n=1 Tax=Pseudomonas fluorescens TaxID=294 RepID=A0A5E7C8Y0_PSEFL|nr:hypothetical protein PS691_02646 [Pseudomonas fluorescens]
MYTNIKRMAFRALALIILFLWPSYLDSETLANAGPKPPLQVRNCTS